MNLEKRLLDIYESLRKHFGYQNWWPGDTPFEIIVGAILTQNTAWTNVERAINNLKREGMLSFEAMVKVKEPKLAKIIRPSGYFNQKAKKLKNFLAFVQKQYEGDLKGLKKLRLGLLREKLLAIKGIGPETADSIILYAFEKKSFVVDAYTKRIFSRIGLVDESFDYDRLKSFFTRNLPKKLKLYSDYHAQLVMLGKEICRKKPLCEACPVKGECDYFDA